MLSLKIEWWGLLQRERLSYEGRVSYEEIRGAGTCYFGYDDKSERSGKDRQGNGECEVCCLREYHTGNSIGLPLEWENC